MRGQLTTPEEFGSIVLRANRDGSTVRLRDVARIEVGGMDYRFTTRLNGKPTAGLSVMLAPGANALATASAVEAKMKELSKFFPATIAYDIPYNITPVVKASIEKVVHTLIEAVVLVFLVMFLFLQNIRYTIIPTIVVPVALLGTCSVLLLMGYSINMLTMFGMVLAIGILVDDAIVVVENVERIMAEEGLPPKEATRKAMSQITSAIIGITLVLMAVFVPMAFFPGSVGIIYRQFSVTVVAAIAFSALMALSLTPALCATLLKPVKAGHGHARKGLFGWFNRALDGVRAPLCFDSRLVAEADRTPDADLRCAGWRSRLGLRSPARRLRAGGRSGFHHDGRADAVGFVPWPDRSGGRGGREISGQTARDCRCHVPHRLRLLGAGHEHGASVHHPEGLVGTARKNSAANIVADTNRDLSSLRDAKITALQPPPIDNLGNSSGFSFRLQDRGQKGYEALTKATDQLIAEANASPVLKNVYVEGLPPAPQVNLVVDREKASAFGVTFQDINDTISTNLGSTYVNDFPNRGRMQRVIVQADRDGRTNADDILNYNVKNSQRPAGPVLVVRLDRMVEGTDPDRRLQLLSVHPHQRRGAAGLHLRRRHRRDGAACGPSAARLRL